MAETCDRMLAMAERFSVPAEIAAFRPTKAAKKTIAEVNQKRIDGQGKQQHKIFYYAHLPETFPACFIPQKADVTPVLSIEETKYSVAGMFNFKKGDGDA